MSCKLAVIGVGNMAKAIIAGIQKSDTNISEIILFDKNKEQYLSLPDGACSYKIADSVFSAVNDADCVLLSVKPQNMSDVLAQISKVEAHSQKLYITIAAGITVDAVSGSLGNARTVRVLPNLPMTVGHGVSVICKNEDVAKPDFDLICSIFEPTGSTLIINESEMNRIIGVTSSSPAYVFKFINAIYKGALAQGLPADGLVDAICDVFIGSALLLKQSGETPDQLASKVASKGGTTERALLCLESADIDRIVLDAMLACTERADELGADK
ncbi:MAG: pyrroline-5-carboxylate reductase [Ruminococcaceae bacterium]|nr:pyrroline-5-carboxylate reductase [Oscillospiraceae bacterium]